MKCFAISTLVLLLTAYGVHAQEVHVAIDTSQTTGAISAQFGGLSYETRALLPQNGVHYFRPDNLSLVRMFKTLGVKNLRIGGNTADDPHVPMPQKDDIDALFAFAKAADVQVIYSVRLKNGDAEADAQTARYIATHFAAQLYCLCIGNEPNVYDKPYEVYQQNYQRFLRAIIASAPRATVCGPSTTPGKVQWVADFARDFSPSGHIKFLTQHSYPGGSALKVTDPAAARDAMLEGWPNVDQHMYDLIAPISKKYGVPYRLEEVNSFFHGGAANVSNTFASALWGLEYMYWWAAHGAIGVNFHTGDHVASANKSVAAQYAVFTSNEDGYAARPLGYGMLAFDLAGHGPLVKVRSSGDSQQLVVYAAEPSPSSLFVTLINKSHANGAAQQVVNINTDRAFGNASVIFLRQATNDPSATSGVTLGDAAIQNNGEWNGQWKTAHISNDGKQVTVTLPPASAAIVRLRE